MITIEIAYYSTNEAHPVVAPLKLLLANIFQGDWGRLQPQSDSVWQYFICDLKVVPLEMSRLYHRTYYVQRPIDHIVSPLSPYQWMSNDASGGDGIPFTAG